MYMYIHRWQWHKSQLPSYCEQLDWSRQQETAIHALMHESACIEEQLPLPWQRVAQ